MLRACELCCWTDRSELGQDETMGQNETTGQDVIEGQDETEDQDETMDQDMTEDQDETTSQDVTEGQDETMGQNEMTGQDVIEGQDETEDQDETMDQDMTEDQDETTSQDVTEGQDETMGQNEMTGQDVIEGQDETEDQDETMDQDMTEDQDETPGQNVKPDYSGICDMYRRLNDERKIIGIPTWLQSRFLINKFMLDGLNGRASFSELKKSLEEKEIKLEDFINDFSKDDACMFVAALNSNKDQTSEPVLWSDTLTNKFNLNKNVLNFYCSIDTLTKALPSAMEPVVPKALEKKNTEEDYEQCKTQREVNQRKYGISPDSNQHPSIVLAQKEPEGPSTSSTLPVALPPMSNEKKMQLEMARNMKKNEGFSDDVILRICNLLTADDIAKM